LANAPLARAEVTLWARDYDTVLALFQPLLEARFDQPKLCAMYLDKKIANSVEIVQTLSRLNRTHPLKSQEDLFVLDFANEAEDIQKAFKPYYEEAVTTPVDPNLLYLKQRAVMDHQLILESELDSFAEAYLSSQPSSVIEDVTSSTCNSEV